MAWDDVKRKYVPRNNDFYRRHYSHVIMGTMVIILLLIAAVGMVFYQLHHRPKPVFYAAKANRETMQLKAYDEPNLLPNTILRFASNAATVAYTFDYVNYNQQLAIARNNFTEDGWQDYLRSVSDLIRTLVQNQLFITGVVSGPPVISNQGPLPGHDYVWRVQIPFMVNYQSGSATVMRDFVVVVTIVRVPTHVNAKGIGIDQFVMVQR